METKKTKIIGIVSLVAIALTVVTATYAFFQAQVGDPAAVDISVNANTVDTFTFSVGDPISINLNQENFATGTGNQTSTTTASAMLTANNKTNSATEAYYMYLKITDNTYTYSIGEDTPEIILSVTDASGAAVEISGLTPVTATGANGTSVTGYDITTKSGLITILNNREITTTSSKEEKWNITITFINYDQDQSTNAGKSMNAKVMIQKEKIPLLADYIKAQYTGTQGENNIYHHDGSLDNGINDGSYRYAGASADVNNYVCINSTETTCSDANLFRIIGVFGDQVKLIKSTAASSTLLGTDGEYSSSTYYHWNYKNDTSNYNNTWSYSLLNKTNLNTNYISNIGSNWSAKIATTTWKVGGNTYANILSVVPATAYANEITSPVTTYSRDNATTYSAKIGLMYVSDYGFAADPSAWSTAISNYYKSVNGSTIKSLNWMTIGYDEWTISRKEENTYDSIYVGSSGGVNTISVSSTQVVRPVFYLLNTITYSSGTGTGSDPIRIN